MDKNRFWSKSPKNWQFSVNKVWKMTNKHFFSNKIQNAHSIWFPHRFSILRSKATPKGPVDGPDPPVAVFEGQHVHVWVFFEIFFFPRHYYANSQVSMSALFEKVENGEVLSQSTVPLKRVGYHAVIISRSVILLRIK